MIAVAAMLKGDKSHLKQLVVKSPLKTIGSSLNLEFFSPLVA